MMIFAPVTGSRGQGSRSCWRPSARDVSAPSYPLRLTPRTQRTRLAHAARVLWSGWHTDRRRRWHLSACWPPIPIGGVTRGRDSIRRGEALLADLFRCARRGKKLQVAYTGDAPPKQRRGAPDDSLANNCISFGDLWTDRAIAQEVLAWSDMTHLFMDWPLAPQTASLATMSRCHDASTSWRPLKLSVNDP
jgi:hypothetical protein